MARQRSQTELYAAYKPLYDVYFDIAHGRYWRTELQDEAAAWAAANAWVARQLNALNSGKRQPPAPKGPKLVLTHVPLDRQGYGKDGQQHGVGEKVYRLEHDDGREVWRPLRAFRARDRKAAIDHVRQTYPGARF